MKFKFNILYLTIFFSIQKTSYAALISADKGIEYSVLFSSGFSQTSKSNGSNQKGVNLYGYNLGAMLFFNILNEYSLRPTVGGGIYYEDIFSQDSNNRSQGVYSHGNAGIEYLYSSDNKFYLTAEYDYSIYALNHFDGESNGIPNQKIGGNFTYLKSLDNNFSIGASLISSWHYLDNKSFSNTRLNFNIGYSF